jgi:hypothetical protein
MYGDYSRGHEPDRKRGRNYRRVLLQMGRPVLDSDVASLVDAVLGEVRATARGVGCAAGSPDYGFLVTPGRLLSVFAGAAGDVTATQGTPDVWIDYRHRFAERYPALYVRTAGGAALVTLPSLQPLDTAAGGGRAALWARVEAPTSVRVNGAPVNLTPGSTDVPQRTEFAVGAPIVETVEIGLDAGTEVWLFLLEQDEQAGTDPAFWIAPGTFHLDGLTVDAHGGGQFPSVAFPDDSGFPWSGSPTAAPPLDGLVADGLAPGTMVVAYLEAWERHVTAVEDPGIREEALGATDTTARTELLAQVKLATVTGTPTADALRAAFDSVAASTGRLTIEVPETTPTSDPCDLPELAGYTGSDNRLYRIEVHEGGSLAQVRFKWSRDNGSELFAARLNGDDNLVFDPGTPLAAGDIVEVLSHVVDLGDDALASVGAGGFVPSRRAVGQLAQLAAVGVASAADEVVFRLVDRDNPAAGVPLDDARHGTLKDSVLKLRRWHGILEADSSSGPHVLEEGISVQLPTGSFHPGEWWQYEARVSRENANGPWREEPHGPERHFAPLALLEFTAAGQPLRLVAWLDERFSPSCDLDADDVAFAGGRVGSASDTVQEAIEELFEREIHESSCTVTVYPGADLEAAIATLPADGGEICFEAGTYDLTAPLVFNGRTRVVVHGAGPATLIRALQTEAALVFQNCSEIAVRSLRAAGGYAAAPAAREHLNGAITFVGSSDVSVSDCVLTCPDAQADSRGHVRSGQTCVTARAGEGTLRVRLERNRFDVGTLQTGVLLVDPAHAYVAGNNVRVAGARDLATGRVVDEGIVVAGGAVGTVEILDNLVEETIQGIHVAASGRAAGREAAEAVLLSRNVVHARVPAAHRRERHAIYVGNARSVHVKDTIATLERTGEGAQTAVDAIRLYGNFGPFVAVRQTSARNFTTGVRVRPLEPLPSPRMWLVAETMAQGGSLGAEVPEAVEAERNYPEHRPVATLTLVPVHATRAVGTEHTITATARDVAGAPVAGVWIRFRVLGPANVRAEHAVKTNASGISELKYTGTNAGTDAVRAYADSNGNGRQDADEPPTLATVELTAAAATVELAQNTATSLRGSTTILTATVRTDAAAPVFDARVVFAVTGANPQPLQGVRTNAAGQATFSYAGANAGTDTIRAFADANANNVRDTGEPEVTVTHVYTAPVAASVTLLPTSGIAPVGSTRLFSATVRDAASQPLPGAVVRFVVTGANPRTGSATTNASGVATFLYTGSAAGTDNVVAFADINNNTTREANEPMAQATQTFTVIVVNTTVPSLFGMTQPQASAALSAADLALGTVTRLPDPPRDTEPGGPLHPILRGPFVVDQSLAPNADVPKGTRVNITVQREWF